MPQAGWYVLRGKVQRGPFSDEEIRSSLSQGKVSPEVMVWREGMAAWVFIRDAFPAESPAGMPPPPPPPPCPVTPSSAGVGSAASGTQTKWYFQTWFIALLLFTVSPAGIVLMWLQKPRARFFGNVGACVAISILFGVGWTVGLVKSCASCGFQEEQHLGGVECAPNLIGYQCTLTHMQGSHPINMCWQLNVTCANGLTTASRECGDVEPLGISSVLMPFALIPQWEKCDTVVAASVTNMEVTVY